MSNSTKPTDTSTGKIKHTKAEWQRINPFLSDEEAEALENNPPTKPNKEQQKDHDYPLD